MIGAHTDSPCLRIKPAPDVRRSGFHQLGVEIYGGVLLAPWFDRDLSIAGRVTCSDTNGQRLSLLIDFKKPIVTIPSLAIHLNRDIHKNRTINPQQELVPILCDLTDQSKAGFRELLLDQIHQEHPEANVQAVTDYELSCYDTQGAQQVGLQGDFLASARLDNLLSCYTGLRSLLDTQGEQTVLLVCNDHEEVGSASAAGAQGPFLHTVLERLCGDNETMARVLARSLLISADNAHALHPNYEGKHDPQHQPRLNGGPVIKFNANQRYATNSETASIFRGFVPALMFRCSLWRCATIWPAAAPSGRLPQPCSAWIRSTTSARRNSACIRFVKPLDGMIQPLAHRALKGHGSRRSNPSMTA